MNNLQVRVSGLLYRTMGLLLAALLALLAGCGTPAAPASPTPTAAPSAAATITALPSAAASPTTGVSPGASVPGGVQPTSNGAPGASANGMTPTPEASEQPTLPLVQQTTPTATPVPTATPSPTPQPTRQATAAPTLQATAAPTPTPAVGGFDRYRLNQYPQSQLQQAGLYVAWPAVVDALYVHTPSLSAEAFGLQPHQLEQLIQTYRSYHVLGTTVAGYQMQGSRAVIQYRFDEAQHAAHLATFEQKVAPMVRWVADPQANTLDRMLAAYIQTASIGKYDNDHILTTAFDVLVFDYGICYGYAELFSFLLLQAGIDSLRIVNAQTTSGEEHGWVMAEYNGQYYHFDPMFEHTASRGKQLGLFAMNDTERKKSGGRLPVQYGYAPWPVRPAPQAQAQDSVFTTLRNQAQNIQLDVAAHQLRFTSRQDGQEYVFSTVTQQITPL